MVTAMSGSSTFVTATHAALFEQEGATGCDICGEAIPPEDDGPAVPGRASYASARGDTVTFDPAPLCATCAAAVAITAIQRWDVEEEEG